MIAAWRSLLRLARRDVRRHPGRATLVSLLIAVPVAGVVAAGTLLFTVQPSASERARQALGEADLAVYPTGVGDGTRQIPEQLPAGSQVEPLWRGEIALAGTGTSADARTVEAVGVGLNGLGAGMFEVVRGQPPEPGADEIAVTAALSERLRVDVGSSVETASGSARVVGVVRDTTALDRQAAVIPPDDAPTLPGASIDLPETTDASKVARALERAGWDATSRADVARSDPEQLLFIFVLGGFGLLVASLVTAAAFAVSAQRRQHELALLAASGAEPRHLRRSVLVSAVLLGAVGSAVGLLLGILIPAATLPWLESWTNRVVDGLTFSPPLLIAAPAAGLITATASSWLTARAAGHTPVAAALSGRRPPRTSGLRLLVVGAVSTCLGVALTVATASSAAANAATSSEVVTAAGLLAGAALTMLGLGAMSPWLVEQLTRRIGARMPVGVRLAMRDTARFRSRTGPIVMAIVAGLGLSVAVGATLDSIESGLAGDYRPQLAPDQLLVDGPAPVPLIEGLRETLPVRAAAPLTIVRPVDRSRARPLPQVVTVADGRLLDALQVPPSSHAALDAGQVLVLQGADGRTDPRAIAGQAQSIAPNGVHVVELDLVPRAVPPIVLSPETLDRSGAEPAREGTRWLLRLAEPIRDGQLQHAHELADTFGQRVTVETGPPTINSGAIQSAATGGAGLLSLLIVAIGLALISAETRHDESILAAVGADPNVRRALAAARAGSLTLLGAILAVPAGLLPVWGLAAASQSGAATELTVPVASIVAVVVLVPAAAAAAAWTFTRTGRTTLTPQAP